ncbi:Single-stranded DNA-binding protein [compost metagenome]
MQNRQWEQDGQTRYATEILVNEFQMLSSPQGQGQGQQSSQQQSGNSRPAQQPQQSRQQPAQQPQGGAPEYDDDIPF